MATNKGLLLIFDGVDGCGKGTIMDFFIVHFQSMGKTIFDLRAYAKAHRKLPEFKDISGSDVIVSAEPTHAWIGEVIREEIIADNERGYSALSAAHAFALDREILYRRVIIPAIEAGKIVLQERGVSTTVVYQTVQSRTPSAGMAPQGAVLTVDEILSIPGNTLAVEHAPNVLVIVKVKPETAIKRLRARTGKQDNCIFEKREYLKKLAGCFYSGWFKKMFEARGTRVACLDANGTLEETERNALELIKNLLENKKSHHSDQGLQT